MRSFKNNLPGFLHPDGAVIGHDTVGVVAKVAGLCTELNINIEDVTQSILQGMFAMLAWAFPSMYCDYHTHTPLCLHASGTPQEYVLSLIHI